MFARLRRQTSSLRIWCSSLQTAPETIYR